MWSVKIDIFCALTLTRENIPVRLFSSPFASIESLHCLARLKQKSFDSLLSFKNLGRPTQPTKLDISTQGAYPTPGDS